MCRESDDDRLELVERHPIGGRASVNHHVEWGCDGQHHRPAELSQPALQAVSVDGGSTVLRHDDADAGVLETRKGSDSPNVEMFGSEPLP